MADAGAQSSSASAYAYSACLFGCMSHATAASSFQETYCELGPFFLPKPTTARSQTMSHQSHEETWTTYQSMLIRTNIDESPVVFDALECTSLGDLLLVLLGDLWGLTSDLSSTGQRSVDLACKNFVA